MFKVLSVLVMMLSGCNGMVTDIANAPADENHHRMVFVGTDSIDSQAGSVGIFGVVDSGKIRVRSYTSGLFEIRGLDDCGYYYGFSTKGYGFAQIDSADLPHNEVCVFSTLYKFNGMDAVATGRLIVRRFTDPNVKRLKIRMNDIDRVGVNWVQIREDVPSHDNVGGVGGVLESRNIVVYPSGKSGKIIVTGCGIREIYNFSGVQEWKTTIDNLYKQIGGVKKSCLFNVIANNDDALKDAGSVYVSVYKGVGGYIAAPSVKIGSRSACFEFGDEYVVAVMVNGARSKLGSRKICVKKSDEYHVEAVTSKLRSFYGRYRSGVWVEMQ